jgi:hypothetical protein
MKHQYATAATCQHDAEDMGQCPICAGGLAYCDVCGLYEGCLTTDCPGVQSFREYADPVYSGTLDYRDGLGWCNELSPHCPTYHASRQRQSSD